MSREGTAGSGRPLEVTLEIPNLSEKDNQLCKEFERIERGMTNTLEAKSAGVRAAMAQEWKARAEMLWANAALADSPWIREGMSSQALEMRDEFGEILAAHEVSGIQSASRRWASRFGSPGKGDDPDRMQWTAGTAVKETIAGAAAGGLWLGVGSAAVAGLFHAGAVLTGSAELADPQVLPALGQAAVNGASLGAALFGGVSAMVFGFAALVRRRAEAGDERFTVEREEDGNVTCRFEPKVGTSVSVSSGFGAEVVPDAKEPPPKRRFGA